nr:AAA family ATPase [uncultured Flavobacterium sp.]
MNDTHTVMNYETTNNISVKPRKNNIKKPDVDPTFISALDLFNKNIDVIPSLLEPFLQKTGLASLVGASDSGKSTFLRQLSVSIAMNLKTFLGFTLNSKHNKVIYVSTEDDKSAISVSIGKQVRYLLDKNPEIELKSLENLSFMFETDNLLKELHNKLVKEPVDLIVIDAFTDIFSKELNANTQVRQFLNEYDKLAKKHDCLIIFLHHIGKNTLRSAPNKDSIIGSQAFEAKMRVVLELRPNRHNSVRKDLWVLKGNFLEPKHKNNSHIMEMNDSLIFENTGEKDTKSPIYKKSDPELVEKITEFRVAGLSCRKIEDALKDTKHKTGKSTIAKILNEIDKPSK